MLTTLNRKSKQFCKYKNTDKVMGIKQNFVTCFPKVVVYTRIHFYFIIIIYNDDYGIKILLGLKCVQQ